MLFAFISFVAGVLTVLAPCVLPLLPVVVAGSVSSERKMKPFVIVLSLCVSVVVFSLLLKTTSALFGVSVFFWQMVSAVILGVFGLTLVFDDVFKKGFARFNLLLQRSGNKFVFKGLKQESFFGDVLIGVSLGPVFSSCSPTYLVILATILPQSIALGFVYLLCYTLGLGVTLLLIAFLGQRFVSFFGKSFLNKDWFRYMIGFLFIIVSLSIVFGVDKKIESALLKKGFFDVSQFEKKIEGLFQSVPERFEDK